MIYVLLFLAVLAIVVVGMYNGLVKLKNKAAEAWSDIDTQLKRRYDLIPNIVETVKGYASHEADTLQKVTEARTAAMNAQNLHDKEQAENMLSDTLKSIFALSEQYPDLKANQNFLDLQKTLKDIEEHVQMSRRYYNGTVRELNTKIETIPYSFIAGPLGFKKREFFQATDEEKAAVKVDFKKDQEPAAPATPEAPAAPTPEAPAAEAPTPETPAPAQPEATEAAAPTPETPAPAAELKVEPTAEEAPAETPAPEAPATPENPAAEAPTPEAPEAPAAPETPAQPNPNEDKPQA